MFGKYKVEDDRIVFPCKCEFKYDESGVDFSIESIPTSFNCPLTWELYGQGLTIGVFQLESGIGRYWSKRLKPENIEHLSAMVSILRPGCLDALDENKVSITEHYCRRKNGEEDPIPIHDSISHIIEESYQLMIYQEHSIKVAELLAGLSPQEADLLRKGMGKKLPEVIAKCKITFMEGCKKTGIVDEKTAERIFDIIEKSQKYNFNKSHSVEYAFESYRSAFIKAHFPLEFFPGCLSSLKKNDVPFLIEDAKYFNIKTQKPDIRKLNDSPFIENDNIILSIANIKGVGEASFVNIQNLKDSFDLSSWLNFLVKNSESIGFADLEKIIKTGGLDFFGYPRKKLLFDLSIWKSLTNTERLLLVERYEVSGSLLEFLEKHNEIRKNGGVIANKRGIKKYQGLIDLLKNPPHSLEDTPAEIASYERELLGISLTQDRLDGYTTEGVNTTCLDLKSGKHSKDMLLAVEIVNVFIKEVGNGPNKGKKYAKLVIRDRTGDFEINCFSKEYQECHNEIFEGSLVFLRVDSLYNNQGYKISKIQALS